MRAADNAAPALPAARGRLTEELAAHLVAGGPLAEPALDQITDPLGDDDFQLALYECYELHYRSFAGVPDEREWSPDLIRFRRALEARFAAALVPLGEGPPCHPNAVGETLFSLASADESPSLAEHLARRGTLEQFREFMAHRSAYQLKEADPHTWAIPRLAGGPKAAMVEVQADEYGSGDPNRMHSTMFARAMTAVGLDAAYGTYVERLPGATLATVNLISLFGLNRARRGALVGHLAMFEITSPGPNRRYAEALRRLGFGPEATEFYDEHVEADSVHENIAAYDLAQGLAEAEPGLADEILFGARTLLRLDDLMAEAVLAAWDEGRSSLLPARERAAVAA